MASALTIVDNKPKSGRRIVAKHHWLVRATHWLNIPLLLGLTLSGLSIYWAAPVYKHTASLTDQSDYLADIGALQPLQLGHGRACAGAQIALALCLPLYG
jgi:hypothetical protein